MPKKYIQFLSVNFCLIAIAAMANSDSIIDNNQNFLVLPNNKIEKEVDNDIIDELIDTFHQIWDCLDKINTIHPSEEFQNLISQHEKKIENPIQDENLKDVSRESLENQFSQLKNSFAMIRLKNQPEDTFDETELNIQLNEINASLEGVYNLYKSKMEFLSKKEKNFLKDLLEELQVFLQKSSLEKRLNPLSKIQELLDSCKEEDQFIYSQYEFVINSEEVNPSDFLTDSQEVPKHLLYFNKNEGLVEIQHEEDKTYTTTWKIGKADINLVKNWKEEDLITIKKTRLLSKYSMSKYIFGESLDFTISNGKTSARANFVCKSSNQNTYTILAIDYLEGIVILKNGPCLFVRTGDLKDWHIKDIVILQRLGSSLDATNPHKLINTTRTKEISVSLKKPGIL